MALAALDRVSLAFGDLPLLDQVTLQIEPGERVSVIWLETFLPEYPGTVVFVTHDRAFLQSVATRIVELDRGRLTSWPGDYATFLKKKEEWLANEAARDEQFVFRARQRRSPRTGIVSFAGLLDFDDTSTHVRQQHRAVRAREYAGEIQNGDAFQRPHIVPDSVSAS